MADIKLLIVTLLSTVIFMLMGRVLALRSGSVTHYYSYIQQTIVGLGVWYVSFLVLCVLFKMSLVFATAFYSIAAVIFFFVFTKLLPAKEEVGEHFWSVVGLLIMLIAPVLYWLASDTPLYVQEFIGTLKNANHIMKLDSLPLAKDVEMFNMKSVEQPLAFTTAILPASIMMQKIVPAVFVVMQTLLFGLTSTLLAREAGINIRWSNLPYVVAGGAVAITLLNPFFSLDSMTTANAVMWFAVTFFIACTPLVRVQALPRGWSVLPHAFVLAFLLGLNSDAIFLLWFVIAVWVLRSMFEGHAINGKDIVGWLILGFLPFASFQIWEFYIVGNGFAVATILNEVQTENILFAVTGWVQLAQQEPWLFIVPVLAVILLLVNLSKIRSLYHVQQLFVSNAAVTVSALACAYVLLIMPMFSMGVVSTDYLYVLQFVVLLPIWQFARARYDNSSIKNLAFQNPWVFGLLAVAILLVEQKVIQAEVIRPLPVSAQHTLDVAAHARENYIKWSDNVAVVEGVVDGYNTAVLAYGLNHYAKVFSIDDLVEKSDDNFAYMHKILLDEKFKWMWVSKNSVDIEKLIGAPLAPNKSQLFEVKEDGLHLVQEYKKLGKL